MVSVIRLSKEGQGTSGLEKCSVVPVEAVLTGAANERGEIHFESGDGKFMVGTWECTPYAEMLVYPDMNEYCVVISGRVALTNPDGSIEEFGTGDSYIVPMGFEGRFEVLETLRKIYVLYTESK